jgi:hypothetical protein
MYILKEIVCLNLVITTKILSFSTSQDDLTNLMYFYERKAEKMFEDIKNGQNLYCYWLYCAEGNQEYYTRLVGDLSEDEKRQLKMKDLPVPEFIKYEVVELVKQLSYTDKISSVI